MFRSFLSALSSKVFGAGQTDVHEEITHEVVQESEKCPTDPDFFNENKNNSATGDTPGPSVPITPATGSTVTKSECHTPEDTEQQKKGITDTEQALSPEPCENGSGQDMSEWVTLDTPKRKTSEKEGGNMATCASSRPHTGEGDKASSKTNDLQNSQEVHLEQTDDAIGEKNSNRLDEDSFSDLLVTSMLDEIVSQMSEESAVNSLKGNNSDGNTNQNAAPDSTEAGNQHEGDLETEKQKTLEKYQSDRPQRMKKGRQRRFHSDENEERPSEEEQVEEKRVDRKEQEKIDPNLEHEDFLRFCKLSTERDVLIRAKKLIYKLGYLKNIPHEEIESVILGQYKIAARRKVHGWIEDARYYAEVMVSRDWIDENLLFLNPKKNRFGRNKKTYDRRGKNRYDATNGEEAWGRKTGGLCQDVRLLSNPNLAVVRVNLGSKEDGSNEKRSDHGEIKNDEENTTENVQNDTGKQGRINKVQEGEVSDTDQKESSGMPNSTEDSPGIINENNRTKALRDHSSECAQKDSDICQSQKNNEDQDMVKQMEDCHISDEFCSDSLPLGDGNSNQQAKQDFTSSGDSFTDPAIVMMVKASDNSNSFPCQVPYGTDLPSFDGNGKLDVFSELFRIDEDSKNLIQNIVRSESPTEHSTMCKDSRDIMVTVEDPSVVVENDSQLVDYLLTVTDPKDPAIFPETLCNIDDSANSLAELEGINDFITDTVRNKMCGIDDIADIDMKGIGDGSFGEEIVNSELVKDDNVLKLIEECRNEDLSEAELCDGAGEAPAIEGQTVSVDVETESIKHFGDPEVSQMVSDLLQGGPVSKVENTGENSFPGECKKFIEGNSVMVETYGRNSLQSTVTDDVVQVVHTDQENRSSDSDSAVKRIQEFQSSTQDHVKSFRLNEDSMEAPYSPTQPCLEPFSPAH